MNPNPTHRRYLFHVLFWLMYGVFMALDMRGYVINRGWLFTMGPLLSSLALMAALVYGHTLVLIPMLMEQKRRVVYAAGIVLLVVGYTLLRSQVQQYWDAIVWPDDLMSVTEYFQWNLVYAVWFILLSSMLWFTQKWEEQRQQVKNIQIDQLQTELKYLRAQVNPHFLFNGLNTVYGTIEPSNVQAREMLVQFADLLRYNLYEADVDWVELGKEADYLRNYVALQRARSDSNLQIELDIAVEDLGMKVAPLLFVAFVENAFKYSTRDDHRKNTMSISLRQQGGTVEFACRNSFEPGTDKPGGIGLGNVKRRLELLYPGRHTLDIRTEGTVFSVHLKLRL